MERLASGSGPCYRLKFNKKTGQVLYGQDGQPLVKEVITPPDMVACSLCFRLVIPRATAASQLAFGGRKIKCDDCRQKKGDGR